MTFFIGGEQALVISWSELSTLERLSTPHKENSTQVPARRRRKHPNWPLRWAVLAMIAIVMSAWGVATWLTLHGSQNRVVFEQEKWLAAVGRGFEVFVGCWFFFAGASIASFLNVVAYRLPRGKKITGFSRCPYCQVGIRGQDNIPLLGWLKLRGRCRACRLPISMRYPGFEFLGGCMFLALISVELFLHGMNLPRPRTSSYLYGMLASQMDWESLALCGAHLFLLTVLLASAMIHWGSQWPPLRLFLFGLLTWIGFVLLWPEVTVVPWDGLREASRMIMEDEWNWDWMPRQVSLLSCGIGLGIGVAWSSLTLGFSHGAHRLSWIASWGLIGATLGWQSLPSIGVILIVVYCFALGLKSILSWKAPVAPESWLWLACLIHILTWEHQLHVSYWPSTKSPIWLIGIEMCALWLVWSAMHVADRHNVADPSMEQAGLATKQQSELAPLPSMSPEALPSEMD